MKEKKVLNREQIIRKNQKTQTIITSAALLLFIGIVILFNSGNKRNSNEEIKLNEALLTLYSPLKAKENQSALMDNYFEVYSLLEEKVNELNLEVVKESELTNKNSYLELEAFYTYHLTENNLKVYHNQSLILDVSNSLEEYSLSYQTLDTKFNFYLKNNEGYLSYNDNQRFDFLLKYDRFNLKTNYASKSFISYESFNLNGDYVGNIASLEGKEYVGDLLKNTQVKKTDNGYSYNDVIFDSEYFISGELIGYIDYYPTYEGVVNELFFQNKLA